MYYDKRQLQAQSQARSTSKSDISSGAFLVVLQLTMDIMLSPSGIPLSVGFVGGPPSFPRDGMRVGSNGERVPFGRPLGVLRPATYEEPAAVRFHRGEKYHPSESNPADFLAPLKSP